MADTYITFGQKYSYEPHPSGLPAHPDGYWKISGLSWEHARKVAYALTGGHFAFDYDDEPDWQMFPKGCLMTVEVIRHG